jgi:hypothetical protein
VSLDLPTFVARLKESRRSSPSVPLAEHLAELAPAIQESIDFLASDEGVLRLERDPYWPKWDSPWWRLTALLEIGATDRVSAGPVEGLIRSATARWIHHFPRTEEELPDGVDPYHNIACFCAIGTFDQLLHAYGRDTDRCVPWLRGWYQRYQLPDGGYNCDDSAYRRPRPRSSMVSTLPPLEALLTRTDRNEFEGEVLDRGADYLLRRRLLRSLSQGMKVIEEAWRVPAFPRFYEYDVLRGLRFLVRWAESRQKPLPLPAISETFESLSSWFDGNQASPRQAVSSEKSTIRCNDEGEWGRGPAHLFPLLEEISSPAVAIDFLRAEWISVVGGLEKLAESGLVTATEESSGPTHVHR